MDATDDRSTVDAGSLMGRYQVHRSDANAEDILGKLEQAGVLVYRAGRPVDALCLFRGHWTLLEIKTVKGKTRSKAQAAFLRKFGSHVRVARTFEDAWEAVQ